MRARWASALLLVLAAAVLGQEADPRFAPVLPESVGDISGWLVVTGDFDTPTARAAMYQLMRYRVELRGPAAAARPSRGGAERVAFVRHPGAHEPMACWERQPPGATPEWRRLEARTEEYDVEMGVLIQVLAVHREARTAQPSP
jgi:hypothetical protein